MRKNTRIIVIGASTGGLEALRTVLSGLDRDLNGIFIICQHIERSARLNYKMIFPDVQDYSLTEVEDKQPIESGVVYFAPPGYHLYVERLGYFGLSLDAPVNWSRPSIDVLFESAAHVHGCQVVGILLTGANGDGAQGIREVKRLGGITIAQNPESAVADIMPRRAIETGCVDHVLDLKEIAPFLVRLLRKDHSSHKGAL
ncbi:MAG: chemotaxis protein CheB [Chitinophagaceae bacterium]|nr:chemotaxis protein CheB [Oligoflexus sp.]